MMSSGILEANSSTLNYQNIQWCPLTVDHPFDQNSAKSSHTNNDWVYLIGMEDDCLDQQVLLLCQHSEVEWVTWLPSEGEKIIHINQLCRVS